MEPLNNGHNGGRILFFVWRFSLSWCLTSKPHPSRLLRGVASARLNQWFYEDMFRNDQIWMTKQEALLVNKIIYNHLACDFVLCSRRLKTVLVLW